MEFQAQRGTPEEPSAKIVAEGRALIECRVIQYEDPVPIEIDFAMALSIVNMLNRKQCVHIIKRRNVLANSIHLEVMDRKGKSTRLVLDIAHGTSVRIRMHILKALRE